MADIILPNAPKPAEPKQLVVPKRKITFGMNRHLAETKVKTIFSELTGLPCGKAIFHGSGRQDTVVEAPTVKTKFELIPTVTPFEHPNDFRRMIYDRARSKGLSHEEAIWVCFPDGKVVA